MVKVLFICHGNICRSPLAEYILKDLVKKAGRSEDFHIISRAVSMEEYLNSVYPPARRLLDSHGISCQGHHARMVTEQELAEFDHIYYMDSRNRQYLQRLFPAYAHKCQPLLDRDVADPYYYGGFDQTWEDIFTGCSRIVKELIG